MAPPRVSVVLPVYNDASHLRAAIRSVLEQTFDDWELVVCDDGSTDGSFEIAHELEDEDERISVVRHPDAGNRGVAAARNRALGEASGDLVAFLDADDAWLPPKLERQVSVMDDHPDVAMVYACSQCIDVAGRAIPERSDDPRSGVIGRGEPGVDMDAFDSFVSFEHRAPTSTVVVRSEVLSEVGGFPEEFRHGQDRITWMRIARSAPVYFLQEVLATFRIHPESHSMALDRLRRVDLQVAFAHTLAADAGRVDGTIRRRVRRTLVFCAAAREVPLDRRLERLWRIGAYLRVRPQFGRLDVARSYLGAGWDLGMLAAGWPLRRLRRIGKARRERRAQVE